MKLTQILEKIEKDLRLKYFASIEIFSDGSGHIESNDLVITYKDVYLSFDSLDHLDIIMRDLFEEKPASKFVEFK